MPHTKGPWVVDEGEIVAEGAVLGSVYGAEDFPCLDEADRDEAAEECHANARLIAAAPDLLAALEGVVSLAAKAEDHWQAGRDAKVGKILAALSGRLKDYCPEATALHAAIAKAGW